jgi:hypothetical protein
MAHPFVHVELNTTDLGAAKSFYGALFGWGLKDEEMPTGPYTMIDVGEGTGGGMQVQKMPGAAAGWVPYVYVDDIAAATAKAASLGGTIAVGVTDVGMGKLSVVIDPAGAAIGLWQPAAGS